MEIGTTYKFVLYNGGVSKSVQGELVITCASDELRHFGKSAVQLQTVQYPLLPDGTPFSTEFGTWYILKPFATASISEYLVVFSGWIKPTGITIVQSNEIVISGTFKSGKTLTLINAAMVRGNILNIGITLDKGNEAGEVTTPTAGVQYILNLDTVDPSYMRGIYEGTVSYKLLPSMGISATAQYNDHQWNESHATMLDTYQWMVFSPLEGTTKFAMPLELLTGGLYESTSQGVYSFSMTGEVTDATQLRSVLNNLSCTSIVIGTNSAI